MIPEQYKTKLQEAAKSFCRKSETGPDVIFTHTEYNLGWLMAYHEGAEFGYALLQNELLQERKAAEAEIATLKLSLLKTDYRSELERDIKDKEAEILALRDLCKTAGVPEILFINPRLLKGEITPEAVAWAESVIKKDINNIQ